ncbi:MAG TPA: ATP-binding protein [Candidatus Saccharimonadales bacterium]|nr:ATP-binding protein [Candidatus Saccharimonadales bacterium]
MIERILPRKRKRAELEHQRLTSLINSMADGVLAVDRRMNVVIYNGAALNILDVNSSMHGRALAEVLQPFDHNNQPVDIVKLVRKTTTATSQRDLLLHYRDGSTINLYLSIAPVHFGYGQQGQRGFVLLLRDITREKSLEEERDEFISVVSHELRTPIAIAEGNISNAQFILDKNPDIAAIKTALKDSHDQVMFLASMVNDLATLSRAERGKLNVDITPIDVPNFTAELAKNYTADAQAKGLELKTNVTPNMPPLFSSELYVREILQNFITNAIKYTEKGSVTIGAQMAEKGTLFTVADTGIGISKSDQEKVFDKFFRSEDYRTRKTSGTGLGLYVTLKLSRLLHAEINMKSQINKGSTFSVFVPNLEGPTSADSAQKPAEQANSNNAVTST